MKSAHLDKIINASLYEGYILYPHREWAEVDSSESIGLGRIYPRDYCDSQKTLEPFMNQTECVLEVHGHNPTFEMTVGFAQPMRRDVGRLSDINDVASFQAAEEMEVNGRLYQSRLEAVERNVDFMAVEIRQPKEMNSRFTFPASCFFEPLKAGSGGHTTTIRRRHESLAGLVEVKISPLCDGIFKITTRVSNLTPLNASQCEDSQAVLMRTFGSAHTVLQAADAKFISPLAPAPGQEQWIAQCNNLGMWPVLVGDQTKSERHTMLSAPVVLYDYPQTAPANKSRLFDNLNIDEMLASRSPIPTHSEKMKTSAANELVRGF